MSIKLVNSNMKAVNKRWIYGSIFAVLLIFLTVEDTGFYKQFQLLERKKNIEQKIKALTHEQDFLQKQIDSLQSNLKYIEKYAREQHKMAAEDEILISVE